MKTSILLCRRVIFLPVLLLILLVQPGFAQASGASTGSAGYMPTSAPGDEYWDNRFVGPPGVDGTIFAMAVSGGNVYVGGSFSLAGNGNANNIAKWNSTTGKWSSLGRGVNGEVDAIAVVGSNVYVGGKFTTAGGVKVNHIAKWNGVRWAPMGSGVNGTVLAIAAGATGVYAGGEFTKAGSVTVNHIAKWTGGAWAAVTRSPGSQPPPIIGTDGSVHALVMSGGIIYAGGDFSKAGGVPANHVAKWNGNSWSPLGGGTNGSVDALALSRSGLYAGGSFSQAGGVSANSIAKWDGSRWSNLGGGVLGYSPFPGHVNSIAVSGSNVYAGGWFTRADGVNANHVAKWDGSNWSALGSGLKAGAAWRMAQVRSMEIAGSKVYVGGMFDLAGNVIVGGIASFDGGSWTGLGTGTNNGIAGLTDALATDGSDVYAGGTFLAAGATTANNIAKWDGGAWSAMGGGTSGCHLMDFPCDPSVNAIAASGGKIYAVGPFEVAGDVIVQHIAAWDGSSWSDLNGGLGYPGSYGTLVNSIAVSGSDVFAGGRFLQSGRTDLDHIAKWDGTGWSALGSGLNNEVFAVAANGTDVYVGGAFTQAGGNPANFIAKWDTATGIWSPLGDGVNDGVWAVAANGSDVYVGGWFTTAGGAPANHIAKWDAATQGWSALASGLDGSVSALAIRGGKLYVGGKFTHAGGIAAKNIAAWNGQTWSALGGGLNGPVGGLAANSNGLYVGGNFTKAGGKPSYHFARWFGP